MDKDYGRCQVVISGRECDRPAAIKRDRLCSAHHQQKRAGKAEFVWPRRFAPDRGCRFEGCDRPHFCNDLCAPHNGQQYRGEPLRDLGTSRRELTSRIRNEWGEKKCSICEEWLPERDFPSRKSTKGDGLSSRCSKCASRYWLWSGYRLTEEDVASMLKESDGCAICHTGTPGSKGWHVDHDHSCCPGRKSCGKCVRGVLCGTCNSGLGMLGDSENTLRNAVDYLERNRK